MNSTIRKFLSITLLLVVAALLWNSQPAAALEREGLQRALRASVQLGVLGPANDIIGTCSGTVLNEQGFILTNYHCVGQTDLYGEDPELAHGDLYNPDGLLLVAVNVDPRKLPVPTYVGQFIAGNPDQDVAVIKTVAYLDQQAELPASLPLVPALLADSDTVDIYDEVIVVGFPGVGGDTVTLTDGKISGFLDDDRDNLTDWFKTDALINGGNSGGTAINAAGSMIGIPSASIFDGERGDALHFIKPLNQAIPIIERALRAGSSSNTVVGGDGPQDGGSAIPTNQNFGAITFGAGYDEGIIDPSDTFASGTVEVHAALPYQKMRSSAAWGYIWLYEGQTAIDRSTLRWEFEAAGELDLSIWLDEGLPDGEYTLQVLLGSKIVQEGHFVVGSANPLDVPAKPADPIDEGVLVTGTIVDYDTNRPLAGAMIVFLQPGMTVADFDASTDDSAVLSVGVTDANGLYVIDAPLPRGEIYSVLVGMRGYQRIAVDEAFEVTMDDPDIIEMNPIGLERQ